MGDEASKWLKLTLREYSSLNGQFTKIISTKLNVLKTNLLNHQFAKFIKFMECGRMLNRFVRHVHSWSWSDFSVYTNVL